MEKLIFAYSYITGALTAPKRDEKGATVVEYALVIGLISLVLIGAWAILGTRIQNMVNGITFT
ncbi:Flp family type IVb pilin [Aeromicrobium sp. CF4.19]|uniref:Flp family type IVb pilin n=1 Tax=Aeromicrobium sp. CF4.19 TaxID=3373082 RepID=UPI003EE4E781